MSVFVDTGAWFALMVPHDPAHRSVVSWLQENPLPLVMTDYVIDETLTLLRARGEHVKALALGRQFFDLGLTNIHFIDADLLRSAWQTFRDHPEHRWSFTDCTSKVVMELLHVRKALCLDNHFREFGAIQLVP